MHILHVFDHSLPLHSGYTFRSRAILEHQRSMGWTTAHLTSPKHELALGSGRAPTEWLEVQEVDGLRFYRTRPTSGLSGRLPLFSQWALMRALEVRLDAVVRREKPDLIQAHSPALNGLPACKVARRHGIPVVYEVRAFWEDAAVSHGTSRDRGVRYRLTRALETRSMMRADAVTCICEGLRTDITARGIPSAKVTVIPNAVDVHRFEPLAVAEPELLRSLGIAGKPVVGFIGSFYAYEGLDLLLDALPALVKRLPDVQVLLVGGGPVEVQLRQQAERLGLSARVHFTGRVPHDQVGRYYALVDVFVYPRRSARVTELVTPLKPLEAMAQGCIFVASDVGGHRELIRDGETGVLFPKDDVHGLSEALATMLMRRERWPALRSAARAFVERERSWASSVARYRPLYETLLGSNPRKVG